MSTSVDQVARLLVAIPYLQAHQGISLTEAAAVLGVTPRQLQSDLDVALFCGLPGGLPGDLIEVDYDAVRGEGVVRLTNAEVLAKPLRLLPDEASTLLVAVQAVREVAAPDAYAAIDSTLAKLSSLAAGSPGPAVVAVAAGDESVRAVVTAAVTNRQRLRLVYDGQARGETTYPVVDPGALTTRDGYAYLEAWSLDRGAWRSYLLDRIAGAEPTGEPTGDHGPVPVRDDWLHGSATAQVTLRLGPRAAWVAEYVPTLTTRRAGDDLHVTIQVADPAWLRRLLLRLGGDAEALDPTEAGDAAIWAARGALEAYADAGLLPAAPGE